MIDISQIIAATAREWGGGLNVDPVALALATAKEESGFNAFAVGDQGHSVGPFQENDQGAGYGLTDAQRSDPIEATKRFLRRAFRAQVGGARTPGEISALAQRPANPDAFASVVDQLYAQFHDSTVVGISPASSTGDPIGPVGPQGPGSFATPDCGIGFVWDKTPVPGFPSGHCRNANIEDVTGGKIGVGPLAKAIGDAVGNTIGQNLQAGITGAMNQAIQGAFTIVIGVVVIVVVLFLAGKGVGEIAS